MSDIPSLERSGRPDGIRIICGYAQTMKLPKRRKVNHFLPFLRYLAYLSSIQKIINLVDTRLTDSTPINSATDRCLKIWNTKLGARLPTMSNVDLAYFSRRRIWSLMSPGIHESRMRAMLWFAINQRYVQYRLKRIH
jgi:hypothetical protein